jgi:APA family basic amino acid/polyamine antiporter
MPMSSTPVAGPVGDAPAAKGAFARDATGLVREVSPVQAIFFNLSNAPIGTVLVFSVVLGFGFFSGASILLGILLATLGSIPVLLYYAWLTASMPRTGGDYVYSSRFIHPAFGFAASASYAANNFLGAGIVAVFVGVIGVSPACAIIGKLTGAGAFDSISTWAAGETGSFIIAAASLTILAGLMIRGTALTLRVTAILWITGLFSLLLMIGVLLTTSNGAFQDIFNSYAAEESGKNIDWYHRMITLANENGIPHKSTLMALWGLLAVGMFGAGWAFAGTYIGGEMKSARSLRRQVMTMVGGGVLNGLLYFICTALFIHTFGYEFLSAVSYMLFVAPDQVPFFSGNGAHLVLFTGLSAESTVIATVFGITFIAWAWLLLPLYLMQNMRMAFAWSFDQILPSRLSRVSSRFHTPVLLTVIIWAIAVIMAAVAAFQPAGGIFKLYAFTFVGAALSTMFVTGISAILFPIRAPTTYASSPIARYKILGIPAIQVLGAFGVLYTALWCSAYFYFEEFGLHANQTLLVGVFGGVFVGAILVYFAAVRVRRSQGIPMGLAFSEIPPE